MNKTFFSFLKSYNRAPGAHPFASGCNLQYSSTVTPAHWAKQKAVAASQHGRGSFDRKENRLVTSLKQILTFYLMLSSQWIETIYYL